MSLWKIIIVVGFRKSIRNSLIKSMSLLSIWSCFGKQLILFCQVTNKENCGTNEKLAERDKVMQNDQKNPKE